MSDRTLSEMAAAEIVPNAGGPNAYMVRFGEGDYDMVNKSAKHVLILEDNVLTEDTVSYGGIMVDFDLEGDSITLHDGENEVSVPSERQEHVLWAVHDEDGPRLNKLFDDLHVPTVREGLLDQLMPRFRDEDSDIRKTDDGWLINGEILVSWDAENHPVKVAQAHVVSGGTTVEASEQKSARDIRFNLPDERAVALPNGTRTTLEDVEMKFLTTVALILDTPQTGLYDDGLSDAINNSQIEAFTDAKSGLHHGHTMDKHTLSDLGVTDKAQSRLWYNEYDHTGVHELYVRREEFENAPIDVFTNASNTNLAKWEKIQETSEMAPIPKNVRADLEERYE